MLNFWPEIAADELLVLVAFGRSDILHGVHLSYKEDLMQILDTGSLSMASVREMKPSNISSATNINPVTKNFQNPH